MNKILELEHFFFQENVKIVCISEHWLEDEQVDNFVPKEFVMADIMCRKQKKRGGYL